MALIPAHLDSIEPEYAWEVATLYPPQGHWSEEEYLSLTDTTNKLVELVNGRLEFLEMPTEIHQLLLQFLFLRLHSFVSDRDAGQVHFTGLRVRTVPGSIREPDLVFMSKDNYYRRDNRVWSGADLSMEVVSQSLTDRQRDYEEKLAEYAAAGIAEYWIVDYQLRTVIVYRLSGDKYVEHCRCVSEGQATSALLEGFAIDVAALWAAANELSA